MCVYLCVCVCSMCVYVHALLSRKVTNLSNQRQCARMLFVERFPACYNVIVDTACSVSRDIAIQNLAKTRVFIPTGADSGWHGRVYHSQRVRSAHMNHEHCCQYRFAHCEFRYFTTAIERKSLVVRRPSAFHRVLYTFPFTLRLFTRIR